MTLPKQRSDHSGLTPQEIGDRLAIRELVDAYAHCANRRDVDGQMSLLTAGTEFSVYMDSRNAVPMQEIRGRDGLRPVFENLSTYEATTHFNESEHRDVGTGLRNGDLLRPCESRKGCWPQSESDDRFNLDHFVKIDGLVLLATKVDGRLMISSSSWLSSNIAVSRPEPGCAWAWVRPLASRWATRSELAASAGQHRGRLLAIATSAHDREIRQGRYRPKTRAS